MNTNEASQTISDEWINASARRLNALAERLSCESYLEIGVCTGQTFLAVQTNWRTGVDPAFRFDHIAHHDDDKTKLLSITSDAFFSRLKSECKYDLIFLDGLHTYDQTYRDLQNALLHSHEKTIILIDDTWPCDAFSTMRDMECAYRLRRANTGRNDSRWHGDTYKIVPLIALFHPSHRYATIIDRGNPQTLMWRPSIDTINQQNEANPVELMQSLLALDNLSACDYIWFLQNQSLYRPATEEEVLEDIFNDRLGKNS